jgi:hypothetical protein
MKHRRLHLSKDKAMNDLRQECLAIANKHRDADIAILAWAKDSSSTERTSCSAAEATRQYRKIERRGKLATGALYLSICLTPVFAAFLSVDQILHSTNATTAITSAGAVVLLILYAINISEAFSPTQPALKLLLRKIEALRPIAGTNLCIEAAEYVASGNRNVLAWRDCAVSERGQLHVFDVEVMRCIYESESHAQSIELACRQAHGLMPAPVTAPI